MAKSKKPSDQPKAENKADDTTQGQDASEAVTDTTQTDEDTTAAEDSEASAALPDTEAEPKSEEAASEGKVEGASGDESALGDTLVAQDGQEEPASEEVAEALSPADPEPALEGRETEAGSEPPDVETPDEDVRIDEGEALAGADPEGSGPAPEPIERPAAAPDPVVQEKVIERRGGFFPMVLGGVVAAAAGFGLSQYLGGDLFGQNDAFATETRAALEAQTQSLDALGSRIDGVETNLGEIDLTSVSTAVADLTARSGELGTTLEALSERVGALETGGAALLERMTGLEKALVEDVVSPAAIAAYEEEIARLRQEVQAQLADIEAQRQEVATMAEQAVAAERAAQVQASRANLRAAVAQLTTEVDAGRPFAETLAPLAAAGDVTIPEVLSANAEEGVATQAELIESYPEAARAALAAARDTKAPDTGGGRVASFLAEQLGARSVTPREGDSTDAILSRAEAAVRGGDLAAALDEIATLSDAARAPLEDWVTRAKTRAAAIAATDALAAELNTE